MGRDVCGCVVLGGVGMMVWVVELVGGCEEYMFDVKIWNWGMGERND